MYSMTGYGRGTASLEGRELTIELKSVNNRFLDIGMKLPRQLSFLEDGLRKLLNDNLSRGHVDVFVNYRNLRSDSKTVRVDEALLRAYLASARESAKALDLDDDLTLSKALTLPDVTTILPADEDQQALTELATTAMTEAIEGLKAMRLKEGERLKLDLNARMDTMTGYAAAIEKRAPAVAEEYRTKLTARIEELLGETEVDRARLATEVAIFADRAAIDEEIVRLNTDGLPGPGDEPGVQHRGVESQRRRAHQHRPALQGRDREAAGADTEHRIKGGHSHERTAKRLAFGGLRTLRRRQGDLGEGPDG